MRASGRAGSPAFGAEREHDRVDPGGVERDGVPVDLDRRIVASRRPTAEGDAERLRRKPELRQHRPDGRREPGGGRRPRIERLAAASATSSNSRASSAARRARSSSSPRRRSASTDDRVPCSMTASSSSPYRRSRRWISPRRSSSRASVAGSWSTVEARTRRLGGDVLELRLEPGEPVREPAPAGIEAGEPAQLLLGAGDLLARAPCPSPSSVSRTSAAPAAIVSPCCAVASWPVISAASPGRSPAASISDASCSRMSSRRSSSRGSIDSSASAARLPRHRSTAAATVARPSAWPP